MVNLWNSAFDDEQRIQILYGEAGVQR